MRSCAREHGEVVDEVEVVGGAALAELLALAVGAVEVAFEVEVGAASVAVLPGGEEVAAGDGEGVVEDDLGERRQAADADRLTGLAGVAVGLDGHGVALGGRPVETRAAVAEVPAVVGVVVGVELILADETLAEEAELEVWAELEALTDGALKAVDLTGQAGGESALGIGGALGDDIDDAVDGVRSPDGAAGAADDLDAVDVVEQDVLDVPVDALE